MHEVSIKLPEKGPEVRVLYVILHHTRVTPEHFDLMILLPEKTKLVTWRIPTPPRTWPTHPPAAERIADHRLAYLEFEGEISNNRGTVTRVATGMANLSSLGNENSLLILEGDPPVTLQLPSTPAP